MTLGTEVMYARYVTRLMLRLARHGATCYKSAFSREVQLHVPVTNITLPVSRRDSLLTETTLHLFQ